MISDRGRLLSLPLRYGTIQYEQKLLQPCIIGTKEATEGWRGTSFSGSRLPNQDGKIVRLSDYRGKKLVIFAYPKAKTPG